MTPNQQSSRAGVPTWSRRISPPLLRANSSCCVGAGSSMLLTSSPSTPSWPSTLILPSLLATCDARQVHNSSLVCAVGEPPGPLSCVGVRCVQQPQALCAAVYSLLGASALGSRQEHQRSWELRPALGRPPCLSTAERLDCQGGPQGGWGLAHVRTQVSSAYWCCCQASQTATVFNSRNSHLHLVGVACCVVGGESMLFGCLIKKR